MKEGLDWIARGIANAAQDIRHKVVEEPWFGRVVTPEPEALEPPAGVGHDRQAERLWCSEPSSPEADSHELTHIHQHHR